ncbi:malto-oligosyltrehalose synthase [Pseudomonas syringae]|uniref:Maltooligosyl trehalose synthase n=3 Tax=Pseudomonas syringae TaxID=317 RepID=A0A3M4KBE2_PSESF|nr:malto-oligosyltrehalose synthase [Pseudomonas syringae]EPM44457.1 maltooligosyl trehalose synthase [Pseudomonas syringae pv. actinidiae ICMP 19098]EPN15560.1 maltooligosyl trehalose synthase [Pseudomonas syringae pv. actinidiae ICMP 19100]EPN23961.1 maltooligosyl trehalose synthase [Pseudomonas syringae pv. actinidiae ICMP 19099]EPN31684.1 maltooligosyl trehalose synthase [Pseudomonas syringae pv. actinidiae ICMP 18883]EPN40224.1 maltooligosyl trehalose synthase [Pseudomonas syringae pv. ac
MNRPLQPLRATQRLQFHKDFTLDDAVPLVPYFASLGISHIYASPLLKARAGSMHGYDVVDPTVINPELGGEPALLRLVSTLREHGMGLILDIVSNHMAVGGADNPWWLDLLEWGRRSPYADFFDIQWNSPDPLLEGQLLLPFLSSDYGTVLQAGEIPLRFDAERGAFYIEHYQHHFPICPLTYDLLLQAVEQPHLKEMAQRFTALTQYPQAYERARQARAELAELAKDAQVSQAIEQILAHFDSSKPEGFQRLHQLLERQHYRLAIWRTAGDDINWRRFFDINELGGLRVERPQVFEATHGKIFQLIADGLVDGLRIDHIDGLANPRGYGRKLHRRVKSLLKQRPAEAQIEHLPIFVEKILGPDEPLREDWSVDGTTGYEFMNQVSLLQHDPKGKEPLGELWSRLSERTADFDQEVLVARDLVLHGTLAGDFENVAQSLLQVARSDLMSRDLTLGAIRRALLALVVNFPIYRTYISVCGRSEQDDRYFQQAMEGARTTLNEGDWPVLDYLARWLGGESWRQLPRGHLRKLYKNACVRFQQLTSPVAAKSVEDTSFYRSAVLLSRNDVGFHPQHFSAPVEDFHAVCLERLEKFPDNLLTTATHDHKRGEDTRTRLAVLSECAPWYAEQVERWRQLAVPLKGDEPTISAGDELMLYQALLGSWPLSLEGEQAHQDYAKRMVQWQEKALREAKLQSSWSAPNQPYETACREFLERLLLAPEALALRQSLSATANRIATAGALNSLAQTLLRLSVPGVPDLYQGTEFWDFSLVDPDNRRPVDYAARQKALAQDASAADLLSNWQDGRIKQALISKVLNLRAQYPVLFSEGSYKPLEIKGSHADQVMAFARETQGVRAVIVVPRISSELLGTAQTPLINAANWGDTRIMLPFADSDSDWKGLFSDVVVMTDREIPLSAALERFSVNLLIQTT